MAKRVKRYKTDGALSVCMERVGDAEYAERRRLRDLFEVMDTHPNVCGNVRCRFVDGRAILGDVGLRDDATADYEQMSSALAMYRAVSMFETGICGEWNDFYKTNWGVALRHKETGMPLMLGEWKGGFQIFTEGYSVKDLPAAYIRDVEAFLTFFVSERFPIGYDGTIAGTVA